MPSDSLVYAIEEWSADGRQLIATLAKAGHVELAFAAYTAACNVRPKATVRLCKQAMILRERRPRE